MKHILILFIIVYSTTIQQQEDSDCQDEFECVGGQMVSYCRLNGLILNSQKTQIITSTRVNFKVKIDQEYVPVSQQIKLLAVE